jgi:hypothetical protein
MKPLAVNCEASYWPGFLAPEESTALFEELLGGYDITNKAIRMALNDRRFVLDANARMRNEVSPAHHITWRPYPFRGLRVGRGWHRIIANERTARLSESPAGPNGFSRNPLVLCLWPVAIAAPL